MYMSGYDAEAFAVWLTEAFERSNYKSFSALASRAGLSRSSVSSLANAKKQVLTDKPSQPKAETVVALARALNEDVDNALLLAGYAPESTRNEYERRFSALFSDLQDKETAPQFADRRD